RPEVALDRGQGLPARRTGLEVRPLRHGVLRLAEVMEDELLFAQVAHEVALHCAWSPRACRSLRTARNTLCLAALASRSSTVEISAIDIPSTCRSVNAERSRALSRAR